MNPKNTQFILTLEIRLKTNLNTHPKETSYDPSLETMIPLRMQWCFACSSWIFFLRAATAALLSSLSLLVLSGAMNTEL